MTKKNIDNNTLTQVINEDKDQYLKFLRDNPNMSVKEYRDKFEQEKINRQKEMEEYNLKRKKELDEKHQKDEDYRYIPSLVWLEMYLPHFEIDYGKFNYSKDDISNKRKCEELLYYFSNICGVTNIRQIFRKKSHRRRYH